MKSWKRFERDSAALFGGARFWANSGERVDFEGTLFDRKVRGQCKEVKVLSLEAVTRLAEEPGVDLVCLKVRRGHGKPSSPLVVMTFERFRFLISPRSTEAP